MVSKAKTIGSTNPTQPGAAIDLETNKAVALRLIEVFNGRRLDLLKDVLHPEFRGRGISAFAPDKPVNIFQFQRKQLSCQSGFS